RPVEQRDHHWTGDIFAAFVDVRRGWRLDVLPRQGEADLAVLQLDLRLTAAIVIARIRPLVGAGQRCGEVISATVVMPAGVRRGNAGSNAHQRGRRQHGCESTALMTCA
ncbi:MAG: hypothetical protein AVDCRST_MAG75-737, partial [uncultured Propionibacteriaceae bacterium]